MLENHPVCTLIGGNPLKFQGGAFGVAIIVIHRSL